VSQYERKPAGRRPRMRFHSRERPVAFAVVLLSTINTLGLVVIGYGSVLANRIAYMVIHGDVPERVGYSRTAQWRGHMPVDLPWWYFAITGALVLAVALMAVNPRWRFEPTDSRYFMYCTTPKFLTIIGVPVAIASWGLSRIYNVESPELYWIGLAMFAAAPVVAFATWRWGAKTLQPDRGAHAAADDGAVV